MTFIRRSFFVIILAATFVFVADHRTFVTTTSPTKLATSLVSSSSVPVIKLVAYPLERVVDGDTILILDSGKKEYVRMVGINSPESVDPRKPVECFGKEASAHLKDLLAGQTGVNLEVDPSQGTRDKYGRLLAYVFRADGLDLGKQMIVDGYAYEYTYNLPYKYQAEYKTAQSLARATGRGLWKNGGCASKK